MAFFCVSSFSEGKTDLMINTIYRSDDGSSGILGQYRSPYTAFTFLLVFQAFIPSLLRLSPKGLILLNLKTDHRLSLYDKFTLLYTICPKQLVYSNKL